jgi:hypothetical protein
MKGRTLLCASSSGLANRLLLLAGSLRVAELTGRKLVLYWPVNDSVGCAFSQLFTNPLTLFCAEDIDAVLHSCSTVQVYNSWHHPLLYTAVAEDGDPDTEIVIMKGWHAPRFRTEKETPAFWAQVRPHLRAFQPMPGIREAIENFVLPERCIGVHLRRGEKHISQFSVSADEHFERIMDALVAADTSVTFLIATDDAATEHKFLARYRGRALSFRKTQCGRRDTRGIEEALIDLLLLSRTRAVLGNHFSSFTFAAGELGGRAALYATADSAGVRLKETTELLLGAISEPVENTLGVS